MTAELIRGKVISEEIRAELKREVAELAQRGIVPGLGVVLVGDDPASQIYVRNKQRACADVRVASLGHSDRADASTGELQELVTSLGADEQRVQEDLERLPEECRRAGCLPGWFR